MSTNRATLFLLSMFCRMLTIEVFSANLLRILTVTVCPHAGQTACSPCTACLPLPSAAFSAFLSISLPQAVQCAFPFVQEPSA